MYNFQAQDLAKNVRRFIRNYNEEVAKWHSCQSREEAEKSISYDDTKIKWSSSLRRSLEQNIEASYDPTEVRRSKYRPFVEQSLYFDETLLHRRGQLPKIFPNNAAEIENRAITVTAHSQLPFSAYIVNCIPCLDIGGRPSQCLPFYTYAEDGTNRRENITDWALEQFRSHYSDPSVTKWDIFHYVYAILHHPEYRQRYAANLRRELPRIPFIGAKETAGMPAIFGAPNPSPGGAADSSPGRKSGVYEEKENNSTLPKAAAGERSSQTPGTTTDDRRYEKLSDKQKDAVLSEIRRMQDAGELIPTRLRYFRAFVKAGKRLAEIHVHYEQQKEYPLEKKEKKGEQLDYRVTKMRLNKDKTSLIYNQFLTLCGIPKETFDYRLGNRSALEWIIDQYQISTDKRSGITNDPNREDDKEYILRLIGQVITVSLETVKIIKELPELAVQEASSPSPHREP